MKALVTGANGLLGQHLVKLLIEKNYEVAGMSRGACRLPFKNNENFNYFDVDLNDEEKMRSVIESTKPSVIVHAGAMTQVDECELNHNACDLANIYGTVNVIKAAESLAHHFIYISTDFVFDGLKGNYTEEDQTGPVNYYGHTKFRAEELVRQTSMDWVIVRTCLVYGNTLDGTRSNIITWVKENLEQKNKIRVVNDQIRTPTYVEDLAKGVLLAIEKRVKGVYHISGDEILTPYQMAIKTAEFFSLDKNLIEKVDASIFSQVAKRPQRTGFDISKAKNELEYQPMSFSEGLERMFSSK